MLFSSLVRLFCWTSVLVQLKIGLCLFGNSSCTTPRATPTAAWHHHRMQTTCLVGKALAFVRHCSMSKWFYFTPIGLHVFMFTCTIFEVLTDVHRLMKLCVWTIRLCVGASSYGAQCRPVFTCAGGRDENGDRCRCAWNDARFNFCSA